MRIKVVVQSPLALVPQLHVLSHSQTAEQCIYSLGRQIPSCSFGSLSPQLPQEQRWWFILICELTRKTCVADQSKINISCCSVTLCSLAAIPLGELEKCGGTSSCGGRFRISELWLRQDLFQSPQWLTWSGVFWESGSIWVLADWNWCVASRGGAVGRGNGISVPNCSWHEKGAESPLIRHFWCSALVCKLKWVKTSDCFWTWPGIYLVPRGTGDSSWTPLICAAW